MAQPAARRYLLATLTSVVGIAALTLFPHPLRAAPFFPAAVVALVSLLIFGVGPAIVAQAIIVATTIGLLIIPQSELLDPTQNYGSRLALTLMLFLLVDIIAWRLERVRGAAARRDQALHESETRYRHLLEQASDGIVLGSREGKLLLANQRLCEMLGYSEAELLAMPATAFYAQGELEREPMAWDELDRTSFVLRERRLRRKDGSEFLAELSVRRTADGYAQAIVRDITERRRAEEAMRSEHALLESILATSVAGILVVTADNRVIFLNPAAEAALGVTRGQMVGGFGPPPGWQLLTTDGDPLPFEQWPSRRVLATGESVRNAVLMVAAPSGERRLLSVNAAPLRDPTGRISEIVLSISDITLQRSAQRAIEEREEQLERITSAMPGVVYQFITDASGKGRFVFVSARARELLGVTAAAILADPNALRTVIAKDDWAAMASTFRAAARSGEPWSYDFPVAQAGERPRVLRAIASGAPGREPGSVSWIGVAVDITAQKRLEQELRQSQKMDSLGRLAGGVAHDFNNLLTVIRGYADVLSGELSAEDPRLAEVREIRRAADRATSLTRQLLAMSRRQVLVPREVDLNLLVQEMERMLRRVIGEDIRIVTQPGRELGWVRADPGQLEQVLLNLAVNARDAMPAGGTLTIGTTRIELPHNDEACNPAGVPAGDYVILQVADTGVGMTAEVVSKVFEPFFTTKPVGEGTGLGLSTVYGIVQQSNGFVTVESEPGNGTSFRVFLPRVLHRGGVSSDAPPEAANPADASRRARILLVEDDDGVRQLSARMLRQYGYDILLATDGAEALAMLASGLQGVDAVVTDMVMPGITGAELVEQLRARWPELPVLYLSGYTGDEVKGGLKPGSRQAFLQKPFSSDALAAAVEELLSDVRPPATAG